MRGLDEAIGRAESLPRPVPPPRPPEGAEPPRSALERADRIEELIPLAGDEDAATALADAGWTREALTELAPESIPWVAADASVRLLLGELQMALERIGDIVAAVKGYTYLDQAPMQRVDVRVGIEQTLVILRHRLKEIEIRRDFAEELPEIEAFGSELNQVWTNIVDNAVDAMDGRGTLTISIQPEEEPSGLGVRVSICDTGAGIPPDIRQRLFEPFYTTKEPGRGTGLGLHISYNAIARHGGRIEVASEPGETCFTVTLPPRLPAT